jgi:hypothetical protein
MSKKDVKGTFNQNSLKARKIGRYHLIELVRERVGVIVTRAFDRFGYFAIDKERREFFDICTQLVLTVSDLIEERRVPSAKLIKQDIVSSLYTLGFDSGTIEKVIGLVFEEIGGLEYRDEKIYREYRVYEKLFIESVYNYNWLFEESIAEYLQGLEQYRVSGLVIAKPAKKISQEKPSQTRLSKRFGDIFNSTLQRRVDAITRAAFEINQVTSDSQIKDFELPPDVDVDLLTATFHGGGKKLYNDVVKLFNIAVEFGGYEGAFAGTVEYQAMYYGYTMAMSYGRKTDVLGEEFGEFNKIFGGRLVEGEEIAGLRFLEPLYRTNSLKKVGNPVAQKFASGLQDRYAPQIPSEELDIIGLTLESIFVRCLKVGDLIPERKSLQMEMLGRVFPTSRDLESGLTGGVYTLLTGHRGLVSLLGTKNLPPYPVISSFRKLKEVVDSLADSLKTIGFKPGGFVPSLELNYHEPRKSLVRGRLKGLGFTESEVEEIMGANDFSDLLARLAPLTDSGDVISFFRAFDLTKLVYEFGGQPAIDEYINFLYGKDTIIRLLGFLDVNRTQRSVIAGSKYSKLIGYLVMLTYAVNPEQLQVFNEFLKRNNLDLLESISAIIERGEETVILPKEQVSLLSGMVAQMVVSDNSGYESQKPLWNKLIEKSAGNVGVGVKGLYLDREGITPTELYSLLNNPSATSPLGEMLNGVRGGRLTSILRYCNLFGLLYSLSDYRNSYQLINVRAEEYGRMLEFVSGLDELSQALEVGVLVLGDQIGSDAVDFTDPLVQAQNKVFDSFVSLVEGGSVSGFATAEPPGIGNSRVPNGVRVDNSLTPEEAAIVSVQGTSLGVFSSLPVDDGSFVRLSVSNLLAQGVIVGRGEGEGEDGGGGEVIGEGAKTYTLPTPKDRVVRSGSMFDPVESCRKFGGTDCDTLGGDRCAGTGYNKSLFPETGYGTAAPVPGIAIDRPLGQALITKIETPNSLYSQQWITELSRTPVYKDSEMLCASLKNPFEYSACISMLKCKKFQPPYRGKYYFSFCPRSLHGGRLAP